MYGKIVIIKFVKSNVMSNSTRVPIKSPLYVFVKTLYKKLINENETNSNKQALAALNDDEFSILL